MGLFGKRPSFDVPQNILDMANAPTQAAKPKFFSRDGLGPKILGVVGDALSDGPPMFTNMLMQRDMDKRRLSLMEQQRQQEMQDWQARQDYERANPKPYRWESNNGSLMELGQDGQTRTLYEDPTPKINWVRADNGDGTFTMVPMTQGGAASGNPTSPVGKLKPFGGGTGSGSGNFPR